MITENGAAFPDEVDGGGHIDDAKRIAHLDAHLRSLHRAMDDGVEVSGYRCWSLLDNLEWAEGYRPRFDIVHVDFATQARRLKRSAEWYSQVIASNGLTTLG